jgi:hypothetical protein
VTAQRTSQRRVAFIAVTTVVGAVLVLGASVFAAKRWARNRLPGVVLADPTPETLARFGFLSRETALSDGLILYGPVVVEASPVGERAGLNAKVGDSLLVWSSHPEEEGSVSGFKRLLAEQAELFTAPSELRINRYRHGEDYDVRELTLSRFQRWLYLP